MVRDRARIGLPSGLIREPSNSLKINGIIVTRKGHTFVYTSNRPQIIYPWLSDTIMNVTLVLKNAGLALRGNKIQNRKEQHWSNWHMHVGFYSRSLLRIQMICRESRSVI